jgi:hypothetical protein
MNGDYNVVFLQESFFNPGGNFMGIIYRHIVGKPNVHSHFNMITIAMDVKMMGV